MGINNSKNNASIMSTSSSPLSALLEQIGVIVDHVPGGSVHRGFKEKYVHTAQPLKQELATYTIQIKILQLTERRKERKSETDRQKAVEKERARGILKLRDEISEKSRDMIYRNIGRTN